jgi:hypothetical protein
MARTNKQLKELSYNLGKDAFKNGKKCIPALDSELLNKVITGLKVGEGIPYYKAWQHGWMEENLKASIK